MDVVRESVAAAGLGDVRRAGRAGAGQRNEVWVVETSRGGDVVVRLLAAAERMAMEVAVVARAAAGGVPVAEVLWTAVEPRPVMVQRRLPGRRLRDTPVTAALAPALAEVLGRIHAVPMSGGFGNLRADLTGEEERLSTWFVDRARAEVDAAAPATAADRRLLDASVARLEEARPLLDLQPSGLVHGDVQPANVLVDGDRITGILDWEAAKGGPPAFDVGWWDWFSESWGTPWPTDAMFPPERDREVRRLVVLRIWLRELVAAQAKRDERRAAAARAGLVALDGAAG